jgi:Fe-S-cluster containining protein
MIMARKFGCVPGCSDCCIYREYYPSVDFGKIGVLVLPDEVASIKEQARKKGLSVRIVPRIAIGKDTPEKIVAYQMMGKNLDGDLCPFLDVQSDARSPHDGFKCSIYENRPAACRAYPLVELGATARLDEHCKFCREFSTATADASSMRGEAKALNMIKRRVQVTDDALNVWRYATATGRAEDKHRMLPEGWVIEG